MTFAVTFVAFSVGQGCVTHLVADISGGYLLRSRTSAAWHTEFHIFDISRFMLLLLQNVAEKKHSQNRTQFLSKGLSFVLPSQ